MKRVVIEYANGISGITPLECAVGLIPLHLYDYGVVFAEFDRVSEGGFSYYKSEFDYKDPAD